jgi:hypothetical protein
VARAALQIHVQTSTAAGTVQITPSGGTQGMEPMHQPAAPDAPGINRPTGDRR